MTRKWSMNGVQTAGLVAMTILLVPSAGFTQSKDSAPNDALVDQVDTTQSAPATPAPPAPPVDPALVEAAKKNVESLFKSAREFWKKKDNGAVRSFNTKRPIARTRRGLLAQGLGLVS